MTPAGLLPRCRVYDADDIRLGDTCEAHWEANGHRRLAADCRAEAAEHAARVLDGLREGVAGLPQFWNPAQGASGLDRAAVLALIDNAKATPEEKP